MYHWEREDKRRVTKGGRRLKKTSKDHTDGAQRDMLQKPDAEHETQIKTMFLKADTNGNGWLEQTELNNLINELKEQQQYDISDITFKNLLEEERVSYKDFLNYVQPAFRKHAKDKIVHTDPVTKVSEEEEILSGQANDSVSIVKRQLSKQTSAGLRKLVARTASSMENIEAMQRSSSVLNKRPQKKEVVTYTQKDEETLTNFITGRWNAFINFQRKGKDGEVVMTSDEQLTDALPGTYDLLQLVMDQFDSDIVTSSPNHAVIKPVKWIPKGTSDENGKLLCSKYWNCTIPVDIGTEQNLSYYGCCYASQQQQRIALLHRHATVDFEYSENYKRNYVLQEEEGSGGFGIERHAFHHMDCPLEDNSGYFLLGKLINEDELHLTAFKIPKNHVLYVPPMIIHSNDHMLGKWRTMLADNVPIDHVHFMKETKTKDYYSKEDIIIEE